MNISIIPGFHVYSTKGGPPVVQDIPSLECLAHQVVADGPLPLKGPGGGGQSSKDRE